MSDYLALVHEGLRYLGLKSETVTTKNLISAIETRKERLSIQVVRSSLTPLFKKINGITNRNLQIKAAEITQQLSDQIFPPVKPPTKVLILCALSLELAELRSDLLKSTEQRIDNIVVSTGHLKGLSENFIVYAALTGHQNVQAGVNTATLLKEIQPDIACYFGVAGSLKPDDLSIGDVVVASFVWELDHGSESKKAVKTRDKGTHTSSIFLDIAKNIHTSSFDFKVLTGPIVASNRVLKSSKSKTVQEIQNLKNDALAVEMEGHGFASAVRLSSPSKEFLIVRGISDLLDGKNPKEDEKTQPQATMNAIAVIKEILNKYLELG